MIAAMELLDTGACPAAAPATGVSKAELKVPAPQVDRRGPPWREFAGAF